MCVRVFGCLFVWTDHLPAVRSKEVIMVSSVTAGCAIASGTLYTVDLRTRDPGSQGSSAVTGDRNAITSNLC